MTSDQELTLCNFIETGLRTLHDAEATRTDSICILGLDNAIIALKQRFGFAKNETILRRPVIDAIIEHVVDIGIEAIDETQGVTLKDYIAVVTKIKKSVFRHSAFGPRAYYDFIRNYV